MTFIMGEDFKSISIADLAPTQVTVGMREVDVKRRLWNEKHAHKAADYFNTHRFPVILGPHARHYLIDHHHSRTCTAGRRDLGTPSLGRRKHEYAWFRRILDNPRRS